MDLHIDAAGSRSIFYACVVDVVGPGEGLRQLTAEPVASVSKRNGRLLNEAS